MDENRKLSFSIIATETKQIPQLIEKGGRNGYVYYGENNLYCDYLYDLYAHSSLFQAISKTIINFTMGSEIVNNTNMKYVNRKGDTFDELIYKLIRDYTIYGGFALQIIRNHNHDVAEMNYVDFRWCRVNEDEDKVYVNKKWGQARTQSKVYDRFMIGTKQPISIFYYKGKDTSGVYPLPMYLGAVTALETHSQISQFHLNNILNNFSNNTIINFNNGDSIPDDVKEEIEEGVKDKFTGTENAGKFMLSFNPDTEHATTFETIPEDGNDKKYQQLYETTIQDIYTAFRINKLLVGVDNENTGFNKSAYLEAFSLYNTIVIEPLQKEFVSCMDKIFGENAVEIKPFKVDWTKEDTGEDGLIDEDTENVK